MKVLIVVDMQNDFITGSLGTKEAKAIVPNVVKKLKTYYNEDNYAIIFTKDTHHSDYLSTEEGKHLPVEHCIDGTKGWLLEPTVIELIGNPQEVLRNTYFICKRTFGAIELTDYLINIFSQDYESIELIGLCTDICVISNAIICKSTLPNVPIIVDASCCAGSTPEAHKKALELMRDSLQINVINWEN